MYVCMLRVYVCAPWDNKLNTCRTNLFSDWERENLKLKRQLFDALTHLNPFRFIVHLMLPSFDLSNYFQLCFTAIYSVDDLKHICRFSALRTLVFKTKQAYA